MEDDECEMNFKIVIVGDSFVGKTNIMSKYLKNKFNENSKATVGVEFGSKQFNIEGHLINAQIWDTAGTEKYKAITSAYYRGAKGGFVVYDITRKDSFKSVDKWVNDLIAAGDKKMIILVIGNKCDLEEKREVTKEQGESKARFLEVAFMETSALSGENLDKAFEMMMNEIYKKIDEIKVEEYDDKLEEGEDINLNKKKEETERKKCCI